MSHVFLTRGLPRNLRIHTYIYIHVLDSYMYAINYIIVYQCTSLLCTVLLIDRGLHGLFTVYWFSVVISCVKAYPVYMSIQGSYTVHSVELRVPSLSGEIHLSFLKIWPVQLSSCLWYAICCGFESRLRACVFHGKNSSSGVIALHCIVSMTVLTCNNVVWRWGPLLTTELRVTLFIRGEMPLPLCEL